VRNHGDDALLDLTERFDRHRLTRQTLAFTAREIDAAANSVDRNEHEALELAAERINALHSRQLPADLRWTDDIGAEIGWKWSPVDRIGIYVPGGTASYPSSVLMNAIAARIAGVGNLTMTVPTPDGIVNPLILLAARLCGIDSIYRIGGAQAIGALAFGTGSIRAVDMITGPGNAWVSSAKRQVYGTVGIDMIAGPTEILVIADGENNADWVAIDLLSQAEHDEHASAILMTPDKAFGAEVLRNISARLMTLDNPRTARESWQKRGMIVHVRNLEEAAELADRIAPEHLSIMVASPDTLLNRIRHAGAVFLGSWTPEAIGDYVAGPSHVLPTSGGARFSSGLSVMNFMKRTTVTRFSPNALARAGPAAVRLAKCESLEAHGLSVQARLDRLNCVPDA